MRYDANHFMRRRPFLSRLNAPQLIAASFALGIVGGGALLALPFTHAPGERVEPLQALFTATSALCVTGLTVVDIGREFNVFGQLLILLLMQAGGLGIITLGTLFAFLAGQRLGFGQRARLAEQLSAGQVGGVVPLLRSIVKYILVIEAVGALLLYVRLGPEEGWLRGLYNSVFHAVSAFNNAGFSLYSDSFTRFRGDLWINSVMCGLILLGSLGFLVMFNLVAWRRDRRKNPLTTQTKIMLLMTTTLFALGVVSVALFEWNNPRTLGPLPPVEKFVASVFQGTSPRTAGFNSIDYTALHPATLLITIFLMFIGGGPGSTAGGIKMTTFFVIVVAAWSFLRGRGEPVAFSRRIDADTVLRALVVTVVSMALVSVAFLVLVLTNPKLPLLNLLFETVSAFGTVGLSMNTTPLLSPAGQLLLILLMYLGRIGPLTFAVALSLRSERSAVTYPAEKSILVG